MPLANKLAKNMGLLSTLLDIASRPVQSAFATGKPDWGDTDSTEESKPHSDA